MPTNTAINYNKLAYQDVIALVSGQIKIDEFIRRYTVNAQKSGDYAWVIRDAICSDTSVYDAKLAESVGMTDAEFAMLRRAGTDYIAEKIVPALFQIAYTRTPNNRVAPDGQPESYDRHYNITPVAASALQALSSVHPNSVAMEYIYDEYFFPRKTPDNRKVGMLKNEYILDSLRQDCELSRAGYARMMNNNMRK